MKTVNICINGAGPVGATLACVLARAGLRVLIIERSRLKRQSAPIWMVGLMRFRKGHGGFWRNQLSGRTSERRAAHKGNFRH